MGHGKHAPGDLRGLPAQGGLRVDRAAHHATVLWWLRIRQGGPQGEGHGSARLPQGCADGWRPRRSRRPPHAHLPGRCAEGSAGCQPRPHPDREGLAGARWRDARARLRRCRFRRPQDRTGRALPDAGGQHRGSCHRRVQERHRCRGARRRVARPGFRGVAARVLLRTGPGNSDAALLTAGLDRPRQALAGDRPSGDAPGASVWLTDLVHTGAIGIPVGAPKE